MLKNSCWNVGSTWIARPSTGGSSNTAPSWRKPSIGASARCGSAGVWKCARRNEYASSSSLSFSAGILGRRSPRHMALTEKEKRHGSESQKDGGKIDQDTYGSPRAFHPATAGIADNLRQEK